MSKSVMGTPEDYIRDPLRTRKGGRRLTALDPHQPMRFGGWMLDQSLIDRATMMIPAQCGG